MSAADDHGDGSVRCGEGQETEMEHTARWAVEIDLFQHDDGTTAHAVLHAGGTPLMGVGSSTPLRTTRNRPARSVMSMSPLGRNCIPQG